jgi:hypothetical protein
MPKPAKTTTFKSADDLFQKLGGPSPATTRFTGMVKPADDPSKILFARTGDCSTWIPLPVSQIDDVAPIRWVHCGNEQYQQVHVTMKPPATPEGKVFADLATLHSAPSTTNVGPPDGSSCYYDWATQRIVCP